MLNNKFYFVFILLILLSCQKIEVLEDFQFNFDQLSKISINADNKIINEIYQSKFDDPYIDHSLELPPTYFQNIWFDNNINIFGTENQLVINIINASVKKSEVTNKDQAKYKEKTIFSYEVNFLVEFILYDDFNSILASAIVEAQRSTTSGKYISLNETKRIIDMLIFDCLIDFSLKSSELLKIHMTKYIL